MAESQLNPKFGATMSILHPQRIFSAAEFEFRNGDSSKDVLTKDAAMSSFVGGLNGGEGQAAKLRNAGFVTASDGSGSRIEMVSPSCSGEKMCSIRRWT